MKLMKPHLQLCRPYEPGVLPPNWENVIKLNQNESPYPPSPRVIQVLQEPGLVEQLRIYPDAACTALRAAIAAYHEVTPGEVLPGNGSDELIALVFRTFIEEGAAIALPDPTYALYEAAAASAGVRVIPVPTQKDFSIDTIGLANSGTKAVFLVNPNNPTGRLLGSSAIEAIASRFTGLLIIDEAYIDFADGGQSAIGLIRRHDNVVVLRTFSKSYGLCGARVGYAVAPAPVIEAMNRVRDTYNVNMLSRLLALAALQDNQYMLETVHKIKAVRAEFTDFLIRIGFEVVPSEANFVLCRTPHFSAKQLQALLAEQQIYTRYFQTSRLHDWLRISIGTPEQMLIVRETFVNLLS